MRIHFTPTKLIAGLFILAGSFNCYSREYTYRDCPGYDNNSFLYDWSGYEKNQQKVIGTSVLVREWGVVDISGRKTTFDPTDIWSPRSIIGDKVIATKCFPDSTSSRSIFKVENGRLKERVSGLLESSEQFHNGVALGVRPRSRIEIIGEDFNRKCFLNPINGKEVLAARDRHNNDRIVILTEDGYGVIDTDGNVIVEPKYLFIHNFNEGYALACEGKPSSYARKKWSENDSWVVMDVNGNTVPVKNVKLENSHKSVFINGVCAVKLLNSKNMALIHTDGSVEYLPDGISATTRQYTNLSHKYFIFSNSNGKSGIMKRGSHEIVLPAIYQYMQIIPWDSEHFLASTDFKNTDYIDIDGNVLSSINGNVWPVQRNNFRGFAARNALYNEEFKPLFSSPYHTFNLDALDTGDTGSDNLIWSDHQIIHQQMINEFLGLITDKGIGKYSLGGLLKENLYDGELGRYCYMYAAVYASGGKIYAINGMVHSRYNIYNRWMPDLKQGLEKKGYRLVSENNDKVKFENGTTVLELSKNGDSSICYNFSKK